ncbi:M14 family zinc carboxypeptidase [Lacinutrix undariae]
MEKTTLISAIFLLISFSISAQLTHLQKAQNYITNKGEVTFSFHVENSSELIEMTQNMSIINYDSETNTVKVWTNESEFNQFQTLGIDIKVNDEDNSNNGIIMSNQITSTNSTNTTYPLSFPLTSYPTYSDYATQMQAFADNHPSICELIDIGGTTEGAAGGNKRLLFIKLSDNILTDEAEPKVMYTSSIHGDEITGYPLMLDLIDYFITAYEDTSHADHFRIKNLIDNSEVWINPMANPDGTYYNSSTNTSVTNARRANANNIDLNRNYPDNVAGAHSNGHTAYELETQHFMTLAENTHFVLSANFHGGVEVVNYPFDNTYDNHADTDWFFLTGKEYAVNCQNDGSSGYMDAEYDNHQWPGVTEGADWYQVFGGRQDYMNFYYQCKEITIELSDAKTPPSSQLDDFWNYNKEALIEYLIQGTYGFTGTVSDAISNTPIEATITLVGHDNTGSHSVSSLPFGNFYRPVYAGTYDILIEAPCYESITLTAETIANYQTKSLGTISLIPSTLSTPTSLAVTYTDGTSTNASWTATTADRFDIRYKITGANDWTEITNVTNPYTISDLDPETTYQFQVKSYCGTNSTLYSSDKQFTTTGISYCASLGSSIEDEYISNVIVNGISNNTQNSTTSGYSDFTNISLFADLNINSTNNTISVSKSWPGNQYNEAVSAWIDFNKNGIFETSENILETNSNKNNPVSNTFSIPNSTIAKTGITRMRVILKYYDSTGNTINNTCETYGYGETEDYNVNIIDPALSITDNSMDDTILIFPNPYTNTINIKFKNTTNTVNINMYDISGRVVLNLKDVTPLNNLLKINHLNKLASGTYFIKIINLSTNTYTVKRIIKN